MSVVRSQRPLVLDGDAVAAVAAVAAAVSALLIIYVLIVFAFCLLAIF